MSVEERLSRDGIAPPKKPEKPRFVSFAGMTFKYPESMLGKVIVNTIVSGIINYGMVPHKTLEFMPNLNLTKYLAYSAKVPVAVFTVGGFLYSLVELGLAEYANHPYESLSFRQHFLSGAAAGLAYGIIRNRGAGGSIGAAFAFGASNSFIRSVDWNSMKEPNVMFVEPINKENVTLRQGRYQKVNEADLAKVDFEKVQIYSLYNEEVNPVQHRKRPEYLEQ